MSDILAKIQAANDAQGAVRHRVEVPEWDLTLYFPPVTLADRKVMQRGVPVDAKGKPDEDLVLINGIVHLAQDKDGKRVFDVPVADRPALIAALQKTPADVILRIIAESGGGLAPEAAGEISRVEVDALRAALAGALDGCTTLSAAVAAVPDGVLQAALADIARAHGTETAAKNR